MSESINIAYTTCFLDVSGVTKLNFDILHALKRKGHKVHVITTDDIGDWDYLFEIHINKPYHLHKISIKDRLNHFIHYLKGNEVKILFITHSLWAYEHLSYIKKNMPSLKIVDSLHVLEPYCLRGGYPDISANKYVHPYIDKSILISENLRSYLQTNYAVDRNKLKVIRNGIHTDQFSFHERNDNRFKAEIGWSKDHKIIGFIGRLSEQKRPMMFLEIAKRITLLDDCVFYIIGTGHLKKSVKKFISRNGLANRIVLFDYRHDINNILASTDLLLAPSLYEGAPLTILEALSAGARVIASDVGAIKEYVQGHCVLIPHTSQDKEIDNFVKSSIEIANRDTDQSQTIDYVRNNFDIKQTVDRYDYEFKVIIPVTN
ncbi:MAG TPA: glycosyltransferase family 4 protein [Thermodesulfobacteriota bacterium]|nr:glycosyltransferase family 4 protein [Thermodesulfobacteriota bacterium]